MFGGIGGGGYTGPLENDAKLKIAAGNAGFNARIQDMAQSVQARLRYHSITLPDGSVLPGLQSEETLRARLDRFPLPENLSGKRVLDIGAWDGWFTFECERRGADVVAVDCVELETFHEAHRLLGSRAEYLTLDVNELSRERLGTFDIVLFFGVLYHLRHPLLGLEKVAELTRDVALIESFTIAPEPRTIPQVMEFYERAELGGQIDNWCGPSPECLLALCRSAGFARAELRDITDNRASVICRRRWPGPAASPDEPAPRLRSAVNNRTHLAVFHAAKDEYLCCYFVTPANGLAAETTMIEIDGFGVSAVSVHATGEGAWQANCVRPAWLAAGVHTVTVRTAASARSNAVEFILFDANGAATPGPKRDLPREAPELCSAELHPPPDLRLTAGRFGSLICYFRSSGKIIGAGDVEIECGGQTHKSSAVSALDDAVWQANLFPAAALPEGTSVRIRLAEGEWSNSLLVRRAG